MILKNNSPITKAWIAFLFIINGFLSPTLVSKSIILLVLFTIALLSGSLLHLLSQIVKRIGLLLVFMFLLQGIFYPGTIYIWGKISLEGLEFAGNMGLGICIIVGAIIWFFHITNFKDFIYDLENHGINHKISYIFLSTFQLIPLLKQKTQTILEAQQCRGLEIEGNILTRFKAFISIVTPLFMSTLISVDDKIKTLEARGFSLEGSRTRIHSIDKESSDFIIIVIVKILCVISLLARIYLWMI